MMTTHSQPQPDNTDAFSHKNNSNIQILLVEDDESLRQLFSLTLGRFGYTVLPISNGMEALQVFSVTNIDLVVLDVQLPILDGFTVCSEIRKRSSAPIIMVSANKSTDALVTAIRVGADSYLPKPFTPMELLARVHAMLRRVEINRSMQRGSMIVFGDIVLNETTHEVTVGGEVVSLTPNEYRLLHYLMQHPDSTITNEELMNHVWNCEYLNDLNFVRVTMSRLRTKIEGKREERYLKTIHGRGYMLSSNSKDVTSLRKTLD